MIRLLPLAILILAAIWFIHWFRRTPPQRVASVLRKAALWGLLGLLVLAAFVERLNPIFILLGGLVPVFLRLAQLARTIPLLARILQSLGIKLPGGGFGGLGKGGSGATPGRSSIRTKFLEMSLDHATGAMTGQVLNGPFAGRRLSDLDLDSLLRMLEFYRQSDTPSANLLETWLDRERGTDWRSRDPGVDPAGRSTDSGGPMSEPEAWSILGLKPGSDLDSVRTAHRRLMQKLHPDRGGSDYLAAKINEAKRVLLKERV
jgi:hypothetical protein